MSDFRVPLDGNMQPDDQEQVKQPKKKKVFNIWAVMIVIALVACGTFFYMKYTADVKAYEAGLKAYEAGDFRTAVEELGSTPIGKTLYIKASCRLAEQMLDEGEYRQACQSLQTVKEGCSPDTICKISEECALSGDFTTALACVSLLDGQGRTEQLEKLAKLMQDQGSQEQADIFLGKNGEEPGMLYSYCNGWNKLGAAISFGADNSRLSNSLESFRESGNYRDAQELAAFIDALCDDRPDEAIELLMKSSNDEEYVTFFRTGMDILGVRGERLESAQFAQYLFLKYMDLLQAEEKVESCDPSAFENILERTYHAVGEEQDAGEIQIASLEELYAACGSNPAGKILIVKQYPAFDRDVTFSDPNKVVNLSFFELMNLLPAERFPKTLDEVSYVIVFVYGYVQMGEYDGGIPGLQEYGNVCVRSMETGEEIYLSNIVFGEELPEKYELYGNEPEFISGGRPKLTQEFIDALESFMELK